LGHVSRFFGIRGLGGGGGGGRRCSGSVQGVVDGVVVVDTGVEGLRGLGVFGGGVFGGEVAIV